MDPHKAVRVFSAFSLLLHYYMIPVLALLAANFTSEQKLLLEQIQVQAEMGGLPSSEWFSIQNFDPEVCYEVECLEAALEIMSSVNFRVNPCEDRSWIPFACRPERDNSMRQLERLVSKVNEQTKDLLTSEAFENSTAFLLPEARAYYTQCVNRKEYDQEDILDILNITEKYGGWPLFTHLEPEPTFPWMEMVIEANRFERYDYSPLFLSVSVSREDSHVHLDIGKITFSYTLGSIEDYQSMVIDMQQQAELGEPANSTQVEHTLKFMSEFNERIIEGVSGSLHDHPKENLSLPELQFKTNEYLTGKGVSWKVDWTHFFGGVLEGTGIELKGPTAPLISLPFEPVMEVIRLVEEELRNGTEGRVAIVNALYLNLVSMLVQESTILVEDYRTFRCSEEPGKRDDICLNRTKEIFGFSLGKSYINAYYNESFTPHATSLMDSIKEGYLELVESLEWMDNSTQEFVQDKINSTKMYLVEPDWMKKEGGLESFYEGFPANFTTESCYPQVFMGVNKWMVAKKRAWAHKVGKLENPTEVDIYEESWNVYVGTPGAYYGLRNQIQIDAGILQKPVFTLNMPGFMTYGGLGTIFGHEMGHSLDPEGRIHDKNGIPGEYWDPASVESYNKWIAEIAMFYHSVPHHISDTIKPHVDPINVTINEDVSDILGVYVSFYEYSKYLEKSGGKDKLLPGLKSFSPQKLFFMKWGIMWCDDPDVQSKFEQLKASHSSGNRRAALPLLRMEHFRKTFECELNVTENEIEDEPASPSFRMHPLFDFFMT